MTGMMIIATQLVFSDDVPYLTGNQSALQFAPGLGFRPLNSFKTALIAFDPSDPQSWMHYVLNIRSFLDFYQDPNLNPQDSFATCDTGFKTPDDPQLPCKFLPVQLGPCVKQNNYGYDRIQPCVMLKINRVFGWVPDILNSTYAPHPILKCDGQNIQDIDVMGEIRYYPNITTADGQVLGYFNSLYFPYLVQQSYRSPLVGVQFVSPKRHVILMIKCELLNVRNPGGIAKFELLVD
ncbi:Atp1b1p [Cichlidogyrus casuarinus]|uniref:Atp1b1p n=1 Tax=Cichlidogyrus casuarinus TaxID=1844966 RepID=A0ABD2Q6V8_9PLAT